MVGKLTAERLITLLRLEPLLPEGGFYGSIYPHGDSVHSGVSSIYYLVTPDSFSSFHQLTSDEVWHFLQGDALEQVQIYPDGSVRKYRLGSDIHGGESSVTIVPADVWQGTRLVSGGEYALCGCTVNPAYTDKCYTHGVYDQLLELFPGTEELLAQYCRG